MDSHQIRAMVISRSLGLGLLDHAGSISNSNSASSFVLGTGSGSAAAGGRSLPPSIGSGSLVHFGADVQVNDRRPNIPTASSRSERSVQADGNLRRNQTIAFPRDFHLDDRDISEEIGDDDDDVDGDDGWENEGARPRANTVNRGVGVQLNGRQRELDALLDLEMERERGLKLRGERELRERLVKEREDADRRRTYYGGRDRDRDTANGGRSGAVEGDASATAAATSASNECCVCLMGVRSIVLFPCKHLCLCEDCGAEDCGQPANISPARPVRVALQNCPICREQIRHRVKVFM